MRKTILVILIGAISWLITISTVIYDELGYSNDLSEKVFRVFSDIIIFKVIFKLVIDSEGFNEVIQYKIEKAGKLQGLQGVIDLMDISIALTIIDLMTFTTIELSVYVIACLLYTYPSPRDKRQNPMPSSA